MFKKIKLLLLCINSFLLAIPAFSLGRDVPIANAATLNPFFKLLASMKDKSRVVRILHIGDSHLQAGYLSRAIATNFQNDFGNAGRGFVFPYQVAKTNGPVDYYWSSANYWKMSKIVLSSVDRYNGPGGISLLSNSNNVQLSFNEKNQDYQFNQVSVFFSTNGHYNFGGNYADSVKLMNTDPLTTAGYSIENVKVRFPEMMSNFDVSISELDSPITFYGMVLSNGKPGILYSDIGINGAQYKQYNAFPDIAEAQMKIFNPDLIILSLGTNEAYGDGNADSVQRNLALMLSNIRRINKNAVILVTTPPDCMKKTTITRKIKVSRRKYKIISNLTYYTNPYIEVIRHGIIDYCNDKNIAFWDLHEAMGGTGSMGTWLNSGYGAGDHIHFTKSGYELQGNLLYNALKSAYLNFK